MVAVTASLEQARTVAPSAIAVNANNPKRACMEPSCRVRQSHGGCDVRWARGVAQITLHPIKRFTEADNRSADRADHRVERRSDCRGCAVQSAPLHPGQPPVAGDEVGLGYPHRLKGL